MEDVIIEDILKTKTQENGTIRVTSRERRGLEFKQTCDENTLKKCLKTIAAFANTAGGRIIFGVTDKNRHICGIEVREFPDEAQIDDLISKHLSPVPEFEIKQHQLRGKGIIELIVGGMTKPPVIATRDCQTSERRNKNILQQGTVYCRRAGKSCPVSSDEYRAMLERRDEAVQSSIFNLFDHAKKIGFDRVSVADFSNYQKPNGDVELYLPEESAKKLNVVDRARLVESKGAPAYEIKGNINLTTHSPKDPRKPMLPRSAARALKNDIEGVFWKGVPWGDQHLRKVARHLGFWNTRDGDEKNTTVDELTKHPRYLERGRIAIRDFAVNNPDEFIEVAGSKATKSTWKRMRAERI